MACRADRSFAVLFLLLVGSMAHRKFHTTKTCPLNGHLTFIRDNILYILYSYFDEACFMSQSPSLNELLAQQPLWRAGQAPLNRERSGDVLDSGWPALNRALHNGGWPRSGSCELLHSTAGIGELSLVLPALSNTQPKPEYCLGIAAISFPTPPVCASRT